MDDMDVDTYSCEYDCPYYQDCYSNNKDVDDAERALAQYCDDCPMMMKLEERNEHGY